LPVSFPVQIIYRIVSCRISMNLIDYSHMKHDCSNMLFEHLYIVVSVSIEYPYFFCIATNYNSDTFLSFDRHWWLADRGKI